MGRICGVLGSVLFLSGCSMALVDKPPLGDGPLPRGTCSTSTVAPTLDAAGAIPWGLVSVVGLARVLSDEPETGFVTNEMGTVMSLLIGGAFTYSAVRGFKWTSECRERQSMSEQAMADYLRNVVIEDPREGG